MERARIRTFCVGATKVTPTHEVTGWPSGRGGAFGPSRSSPAPKSSGLSAAVTSHVKPGPASMTTPESATKPGSNAVDPTRAEHVASGATSRAASPVAASASMPPASGGAPASTSASREPPSPPDRSWSEGKHPAKNARQSEIRATIVALYPAPSGLRQACLRRRAKASDAASATTAAAAGDGAGPGRPALQRMRPRSSMQPHGGPGSRSGAVLGDLPGTGSGSGRGSVCGRQEIGTSVAAGWGAKGAPATRAFTATCIVTFAVAGGHEGTRTSRRSSPPLRAGSKPPKPLVLEAAPSTITEKRVTARHGASDSSIASSSRANRSPPSIRTATETRSPTRSGKGFAGTTRTFCDRMGAAASISGHGSGYSKT